MRQRILVDGQPLTAAMRTEVPQAMKIELRRIANEMGISESELVRRALIEIINARKKEMGNQVRSAA